MKGYEYQDNLSLYSPILLDREYKKIKVDKMLAVLMDGGCLASGDGVALDIGCSAGFFTAALSPYFKKVYGLDIDEHALSIAEQANKNANVSFFKGDSMSLPFESGSVDLVLCNHVYEHVPDIERLFIEIERVLRVGGKCYLGAASRLTIIEPHYHLPFLSWLPKWAADRYMCLCGKGDRYYENLKTLGQIRKYISRFLVSDFTLKILLDPDRYHCRDLMPKKSFLDRAPKFLWRVFYRVLPTYIFVLTKRG